MQPARRRKADLQHQFILCTVQTIDNLYLLVYCLRQRWITSAMSKRESVIMSYRNARLMNTQDFSIYLTLRGFLSAPLILLVGAAAAIAL
jgi:hypothetical protein